MPEPFVPLEATDTETLLALEDLWIIHIGETREAEQINALLAEAFKRGKSCQ